MRIQIRRRIAWGCLFLGVIATLSMARKKPQQEPAKSPLEKKEAPFTYKVPVDVVVVSATVLDKQGNPVTNLTVDDFGVFDDGKLQTIHSFSTESYKTILETPQSGARVSERAPTERRPAQENRPRFFCFFVDDLNQPSMELYHSSIEAIRSFISQDLRPGDQVALMAASGMASYPFSGDATTLLGRVNEMEVKLNHFPLTLPSCPQMSDYQASRIAGQIIRPKAPEYSDDETVHVALVEMIECDPEVRTENQVFGRQAAIVVAREKILNLALRHVQEREFRIGQLLTSLRRFIATLRFYEGIKTLTLLSSGFYDPETHYSVQEVIDKALRSGVTVNTLDVRGVYTTGISASEGTTIDHSTIGQKLALNRVSLKAQEEPLAQLAEDTGGYFAHGNNDLHLGLKRIAERQNFGYVLSYAMPTLKNDGRFHKITLEVKRPGVQLSYRQGYFAPKEEVSFVRRKREDILEALRAPGDITGFPVQLSYSSLQLDSSHYQLSIQVHVDIRSIRFVEQDSRQCNLIHILTVASDEQGKVVDGLEKAIDFKLTDPSYRTMLASGLNSQAEINIPPGRYKLQAVVRESNQDKMGSQSRLIAVP